MNRYHITITVLTAFALLHPCFSIGFELNCQPSTFKSRFCSSNTHVAITAQVLSNSTLTCRVCDGKAIACGYRKRVFKLRVLRKFKGVASFGQIIVAKAVETFTEGVTMAVGKIYYVNLGPFETIVGETPPKARKIDLCDPPRLYASLTQAEKNFLWTNIPYPVC